jgi:hypothetical protein
MAQRANMLSCGDARLATEGAASSGLSYTLPRHVVQAIILPLAFVSQVRGGTGKIICRQLTRPLHSRMWYLCRLSYTDAISFKRTL